MKILPASKPGVWSFKLAILFFLFLAAAMAFVASGQRGGDTFFSNLLISIPMLCAASSAILAFFTGIFSIIKTKDRSPLVFLATVLGLLVLLFILGEALIPH